MDNSKKIEKGLYLGRRFLNLYLFFFLLGLQFFFYLFLGKGWGATEWFFLAMGLFNSALWGYFWIKNAGYNVPRLDKVFNVFGKTFQGMIDISSKTIAAIIVLLIVGIGFYFFVNAAAAIPVQILLLIIIFLLIYK